MRYLRKCICALLALALLVNSIPAQALAAIETDTVVKELRFYSDCKEKDYTIVEEGKDTKLGFNFTENPYKFEILFSDPDSISYAYVTSTDGTNKMVLDASYNLDTGMFETSGHFDESNIYYEPQNVRVEYALKSNVPLVGSSVDWEYLTDNLGEELKNAEVTNTNEAGDSFGKVDLKAAADSALNYYVKTVDGSLDTELGEMRKYYQTAEHVLSYVVPGMDESRYHAYLDMGDPDTVKMLLDDGLETSKMAIEITLEVTDSASMLNQKVQNLSETLSNVAPVIDVLDKAYNIHGDMNEVRTELASIKNITSEELEEANKAVDALEQEQMAFALMMVALPLIAVSGGAALAPVAALFTSMMNVASTASEYVYKHRVGTIKENAVSATWESNKSGGQLEGIYWEINKADKSLVISGNGPMPDFELVSGTYYAVPVYNNMVCPWFVGFKKDGENTIPKTEIRTLIAKEGVTHIGNYAFYGNYYDTVLLPDSLESIGDYAFKGSGLKHISLPDNLKILGEYVFDSCSGLTELELPVSLEKFSGPLYTEKSANQMKLTDVYYKGNVSQFEEIERYDYIDTFIDSNIPAHIAGKEKIYTLHMEPSGYLKENLTWEFEETSGTLTIEGKGWMDTLPSYVYGEYGYKLPWLRFKDQMKHVVIKNGVTSISECVFAGYEGLEDVVLPATINWIYIDSFSDTITTVKYMEGLPQTMMKDYGGTLTWVPFEHDHKEQKMEDVIPTCDKDGSTGGTDCSVCGMILEEPEVIPAVGHSYVEWEKISNYIHKSKCVRCDDYKTETHTLENAACIKCSYQVAVSASAEGALNELPDKVENIALLSDKNIIESVEKVKSETMRIVDLAKGGGTLGEKELFESGTISEDTEWEIDLAAGEGKAIDTKIVVAPKEPEDVDLNVRSAIEKKAAGVMDEVLNIELFDVSLLLYADGDTIGEINALKTPITLTIAIPDDMKTEDITYAVIRNHEGETEEIPCEDNGNGTVSFVTDKFSTYALVCGKPSIGIPGDVTGDNNVDTSDAQFIFNIFMGITNAEDEKILKLADVTGDGNVDTSDAQMVFNMFMGII